ncbi:CubicO group peptidase, beta-lactamase class C family [Amphibacillus marinus]|uniref:CubicO group peptidase, beta-lactamase class C family n=1 Tax=Amphibacillus marinus TaxID=872970 RepID=A0A1H8LF27_9BACI|nr:serine hydrolase [Amphibacillus marinus]SEO03659.1 CubicO group peptidase, beta-lactamase class C family [Amphibacillus marinus]
MSDMLKQSIEAVAKQIQFSGNVSVESPTERLALSFGYANRSEQIVNQMTTRFGIASGCKLITAIAVCQLVERGLLTFDTPLPATIAKQLSKVDQVVTVHQLLTHTSGVPDYFDEDKMADFEELWVDTPMYRLRQPVDFLPFIYDQAMPFTPGERFQYNNMVYILLGLIIEQVTGLNFKAYVQQYIFEPLGMEQAGYFAFDQLPSNTAYGYIENPDQTFRTNIYALPVMGGADGGAYLSTADMNKLWLGLINEQLLTPAMTSLLLTAHVHAYDLTYYGYGIWINQHENADVIKYHVMGYDPGVSFHSSYYPARATRVVVCSNESLGATEVNTTIEKYLAVH